MNQALWAAMIAANAARGCGSEQSFEKPCWCDKSKLPVWPRFLLWLIRMRSQRRINGHTWVRYDEWLWDRYFVAIEAAE